jgi:hypothetical protein
MAKKPTPVTTAEPATETVSASHMITIAGHRFNVPTPYKAGHVCTEGEANALNQTFAEAIRNNLAAKSKDGSLTQADVDTYAARYAFGAKASGFGPRDPVMAEALRLAALRVRLTAKGGKPSAADAKGYLDAHPELMERARRNVEEALADVAA